MTHLPMNVFASILIAGTAVLTSRADAAETPAPAFSLPALPYAYDALEAAIDEQTLRIHHGRHHQGYVDNLNKALAADPELRGQSLESLLARASSLPAAVRNNGGGHWNHDFFWASMAPAGGTGFPSAALEAAIDRDFGSMDAFRSAFRTAGLTRFGSGWSWLIVDPEGRLRVTSTPNQDNPLMDVAEVRGTPILGNDVWEHAYYLRYQNRRGDYLDAWWQVVNWSVVSERFAAATHGPPAGPKR
ncbi:MAG: superoxide dismutase [Deltaproteobacteria bacterium]|nr:superoxide dismutase [Deltaproteobacteria bacterium]